MSIHKKLIVCAFILGIFFLCPVKPAYAYWGGGFSISYGNFYAYAGYTPGYASYRTYYPYWAYYGGWYGMRSNATFKPIENWDSTLNRNLALLGEMQKQAYLEAKNRQPEQFIPAPLPPEELPQIPKIQESKPEIGKIESRKEI